MSELVIQPERRLTAAEFQHLAEMPAAVEWFANIDNPRTRRAYQNDLQDFCSFVGLSAAEEFRAVTGRMCWPGEPSWNSAAWPARRSAANWRPWPAYFITCLRIMRSL